MTVSGRGTAVTGSDKQSTAEIEGLPCQEGKKDKTMWVRQVPPSLAPRATCVLCWTSTPLCCIPEP